MHSLHYRHALVVALAALLPMMAAQAQERTFKYALQNPKGHPLEIGASKFAELVAAKSGGKLKVNVYPGGTLGGDAANVSAQAAPGRPRLPKLRKKRPPTSPRARCSSCSCRHARHGTQRR